MSPSRFQCVISCLLALLIPMQLFAGETASAMLYTNGSTWLNGGQVPKSAALFSGDLVQTRSDSTARINAAGSSVMVLSDSLVKFQGPDVEIEHGGVQVATGRGLATKAGEVTVKPAQPSWTEFQVADVDGRVQIVATKGDLTIQDQQGTTTLSEGQQATRDDTSEPTKKKHRKRGEGAVPAAQGSILSSSKAIYVGAGIIGAVTIWALTRGEEPMSPSCPNNSCP